MKNFIIRTLFGIWFLVSVGLLVEYWTMEPFPGFWPGILYLLPAAFWVSVLANKFWPINSDKDNK